ncbi:MAG: hypothetical protein LBL05_06300 [Synergistaceae bacterium]|nr:hypothetical protein [Synergistaceae bacterium]
MFVDPISVQLPDGIEKDRYAIATYYCSGSRETNLMEFGTALAIEQSTGTWTAVPGETAEVRERCMGRLIGAYEVPSYQIGVPEFVRERHFIIRIAYPTDNFGPQFAMMLSSVIGNISSSGKVKLIDLEFPDSFLEEFKGPKFGVEGIRKYLGVYDRPLLNNMIKPCTGLDPKGTAKLAYEVAVGGVDIVKDDELVSNPCYCPLVERVKYVMEAIKRADEKKREKTLYAFNITDRPDKILENAHLAIDAGANCLMINYATVGLDTSRMLAEDESIDVPILGHSDYTGATYECEWSGLSLTLIGAKLPRLAGLDMIIALTPYGKFPILMDVFLNSAFQMLSQWKHIRPIFPMAGGGTTQGHLEDLVKKFGKNVVIAAGGAIHGHPMGAEAGATAFRFGIDAIMAGKSLYEAAKENEALKVAIDKWGIYSGAAEKQFSIKNN